MTSEERPQKFHTDDVSRDTAQSLLFVPRGRKGNLLQPPELEGRPRSV